LTLIAVNKHFDSAIRTSISLQNFAPAASGTVYTLNGSAIDANTGTQLPQIPGLNWAPQAVAAPDGRFNFGGPEEVRVSTSAITGVSNSFTYSFPAHSVTTIVLTAQ
jgi:alpha-N-arabinofuranosidase